MTNGTARIQGGGYGEDSKTAVPRLTVGVRYRVDGILHEYLGEARLPDDGRVVHVFLRNEWRPHTVDQLPLTLVSEAALEQSVEKTRIGGQN